MFISTFLPGGVIIDEKMYLSSDLYMNSLEHSKCYSMYICWAFFITIKWPHALQSSTSSLKPKLELRHFMFPLPIAHLHVGCYKGKSRIHEAHTRMKMQQRLVSFTILLPPSHSQPSPSLLALIFPLPCYITGTGCPLQMTFQRLPYVVHSSRGRKASTATILYMEPSQSSLPLQPPALFGATHLIES